MPLRLITAKNTIDAPTSKKTTPQQPILQRIFCCCCPTQTPSNTSPPTTQPAMSNTCKLMLQQPPSPQKTHHRALSPVLVLDSPSNKQDTSSTNLPSLFSNYTPQSGNYTEERIKNLFQSKSSISEYEVTLSSPQSRKIFIPTNRSHSDTQ